MELKNPTEMDLYLPAKKLFEENGYSVKGEVRDCDLVAQADGKPVWSKYYFSPNPAPTYDLNPKIGQDMGVKTRIQLVFCSLTHCRNS